MLSKKFKLFQQKLLKTVNSTTNLKFKLQLIKKLSN